ncbi:MAG: DUF423 domain-containing protein [Flavobacteriaceae bacterium CG_4_8_14_3_um_filter_34_10]|nr:DUF423 domain-containing protein [Flavobacteriia bacterium]OIP50248.1 MAG: hypothetical protein AUK33_08135 [Flavobacteriaceae bacterium CG2_30_34_30]PIQ17866.1 MAG: hypothetical protein COW66_09460 [Flavobacteriaceae bacterium CG18_big_fil_WC_8_21_14_2_50_34_36]PIV49955.1 MAG: DUF423 domain-containing protein [Flavobacteriaceae bacterium CG02_land_8_20_14_3_00_34_13]PIX09647.1 MAG: DUF423 domain-containing protein [Flavobacteriaceae bacterium CG_4_8_14_3_um_filter_34_10]PIZ08717.1 MAG: DUF
MDKKIVITAAIIACLAVVFGAFGAHALKELINQEALATFEVGVRYQMYHALALLFIGLSTAIPTKTKKHVTFCFVFGVFLFSGSIYLLSLKEIMPFAVSKIAFLTPIGGLFFIVGWILLVLRVWKLK